MGVDVFDSLGIVLSYVYPNWVRARRSKLVNYAFGED